ncbi:MAG TPA: helix-turn-helix domain-containing protein [Solirubrobacteraceae bacterium]|nr:helix-turn-helix domain-containing protein [Solirubrobacteraceae bacterium]
MIAGPLIRHARHEAGLTQAELAERLCTTQSAIARLEGDGANPRLSTVTRALDACGRDVVLESRPRRSSIDETLVAGRLRLTPEQRIKSFEHAYAETREIALAGRRARGELV